MRRVKTLGMRRNKLATVGSRSSDSDTNAAHKHKDLTAFCQKPPVVASDKVQVLRVARERGQVYLVGRLMQPHVYQGCVIVSQFQGSMPSFWCKPHLAETCNPTVPTRSLNAILYLPVSVLHHVSSLEIR